MCQFDAFTLRSSAQITQALDSLGRIIGVHMDVTLSSSHLMLWTATITADAATYQHPRKVSAASMLSAPIQNPCGTNPLSAVALKVGVVSNGCWLIQNPCGQNPAPLFPAFQHRVAATTVFGMPVLTNGSNRSLRSLGRAKARPLTKR